VMAAILVRKFARRLRRRRRLKFKAYRPRAYVVVPVKGVDEGLADCVASLLNQDYPDQSLWFVVESKSDAAHALLEERLARCADGRARLIVAGLAPPQRSQKLHNQIAALERIDRECSDDDVWVFADADAVPGPTWLCDMVGPLGDLKRIGVVTGYRWLVPVQAGASGLASSYASVLNGSAASFLCLRRFTCAWGGAMALRAGTARRGGLIDRFRRSLSDDYSVTRMCREMDMGIYFASWCLVASPVAMGFGEMLNFARRQCLITRVYAPRFYWASLATTGLYVMGSLTAAACLLTAPWRVAGAAGWAVPAMFLVFVTTVDRVRAHHRASAVATAFDDATVARLRTAVDDLSLSGDRISRRGPQRPLARRELPDAAPRRHRAPRGAGGRLTWREQFRGTDIPVCRELPWCCCRVLESCRSDGLVGSVRSVRWLNPKPQPRDPLPGTRPPRHGGSPPCCDFALRAEPADRGGEGLRCAAIPRSARRRVEQIAVVELVGQVCFRPGG